MTATDPRPEPAPAEGRAPGSMPAGEATRRVLPEQAREDTDAAWGEYAERDDERLYRDRPPHWADF